MDAGYQRFSRGRFAEASTVGGYRVWFSFAIRMVHELAHAYHYWLTGNLQGLLFEQDEKDPELGLSWESHVTGRFIDALRADSMNNGKLKILMSHQIESVRPPEDVKR